MKPEEAIGIVLSVWSTVISTIALIHQLRKDKKKTAPRLADKHKRKKR